jgi:hypothetical protein
MNAIQGSDWLRRTAVSFFYPQLWLNEKTMVNADLGSDYPSKSSSNWLKSHAVHAVFQIGLCLNAYYGVLHGF